MYQNGQLEHGSWFEHVRDWWTQYKKFPEQVSLLCNYCQFKLIDTQSNSSQSIVIYCCSMQIFWVNYEELKVDPAQVVQKLCQFLKIDLNLQEIAKVVEHSSLAAMKAQVC